MTKKNQKLVCATQGCINTIGDRSITKLCQGCYSYIYQWQKKGLRAQVNRSIALQLYQSRLNLTLPKNKVRILSHGAPVALEVLPGQVKKYRKTAQYKANVKILKQG